MLNTLLKTLLLGLVSGMRLSVYNMSTPFLIPLPSPPDCHSNKNHTNISAEAVTIWNIDTSQLAGEAIVLWTEQYETRCSTNFWGNYLEEITSTELIPSAVPTVQNMKLWSSRLQLYNTRSTTAESIYSCKWMSTITKTITKTWVKKSSLYYNSDGSLFSEGIEWKTKISDNIYQTGLRFLYSSTSTLHACPPLLKQTYPGVVQNSDQFKFITIPQLQIQFNLIISSSHAVCKVNNTTLYQTPEKYLVSLSSRTKDEGISPMVSVNTDYSWSHILFDLNALEKMIESELELVEHETCLTRQMLWKQMFYARNPSLIAQYHSGNPWATGSFINGKIAIQIPKLVNSHCTYPKMRHVNGTHMRVECEKLGDVYISPWDNCLSSNPCNNITDYGFWFKSSSQLYVDYITGEVQSSTRFNSISFPRFTEVNLNKLTKYLQNLPLENNLIALDAKISTTEHLSVSFHDIKQFVENIVHNIWSSFVMYIMIIIIICYGIKQCFHSPGRKKPLY
ncbi:envelope glycoprotein [Lasius neglectus virus 2]|uniref:Envelope glycoprotein n=1 Tax=Lasius neglectus virus 2 TaxID=2170211 RepID=A0A3G5FMC9_9VIRU|nr:envelope glycoprotein [Lasius neglectus virus 2]AYW51542.1 envelope glycoprotein [Lasius neglectus virus 2]UXD80030.1 envelope glycoprotein [Lasius neglectus virus 2]